MYYSNGNYEAFARPKKPQDVENKSAYLVGSGLASLSAALFLVRDAQMPGERIHILEELELPAAVLTVSSIIPAAISCAGDGRWRIISSVCGICSGRYLHWR